MNKKEKILCMIGLGCLLGHAIVVYITWTIAYFTDHTFSFAINRYGEAMFEFFFIPITIILGIYSIHLVIKYLILQSTTKPNTFNKTTKKPIINDPVFFLGSLALVFITLFGNILFAWFFIPFFIWYFKSNNDNNKIK
jgi:hypothetical protein